MVCINLIQIPLLSVPSMIHIPAHLLLSVVKNVIPLSYLIPPDDITYLYRLAQENPVLYAELACKPNGLQGYADAMNEFN